MSDPVSETLFLPIEEGLVDLPERGHALFLRARISPALSRQSRDAFLCDQTFKPASDALDRAGFTLGEADGECLPMTLVLPPRQRDETRALLARAVQSTCTGGVVMAAVSNPEGARTIEGDLKALMGTVTSLSKNKCRVFWGHRDNRVDQALLAEWLAIDAPRPIFGGYVSRPGLFAWDHIDAGSRLLADNLPVTLSGQVADLGAGFGYLSDVALSKCNGVTRIDVIEAESRALDLARQNLSKHGERAAFHWIDATRDLPGSYDAIISNPPFHIDRADRHDIGRAFLTSAAKTLKPGGQLWIVANRHLPYEDTLKAAYKSMIVVAETSQYKVVKAIR